MEKETPASSGEKYKYEQQASMNSDSSNEFLINKIKKDMKAPKPSIREVAMNKLIDTDSPSGKEERSSCYKGMDETGMETANAVGNCQTPFRPIKITKRKLVFTEEDGSVQDKGLSPADSKENAEATPIQVDDGGDIIEVNNVAKCTEQIKPE